MVIKLKRTIFSLIFILTLIASIIPNAQALTYNISQISYHIDKEWAVLWINKNSTV